MIQQPLPGFLPKSTWKDRTLPVFPPGQPVSFDVETCDPGLMDKGPGGWRKDGFIVGIAAACGKESIYIPIGKPRLREWLTTTANQASEIVFANALYDLEWMAAGLDIDLSDHPIHDIQIAEPLLDEDRVSYSLDALAKHYLGESKDERMLKEALAIHGLSGKGDLWKLPPEFIGPYAEADTRLTLAIWHKQMEQIAEEGLQGIYELERKVTPVLHRMRRKGVRVDMDAVADLRQELTNTERVLQGLLGRINVNSSADLEMLCKAKNIPYGLTERGNPSFNKEWLKQTAGVYPVIAQVAELRAVEKIRSSFVDSAILGSVDNQGILRCSFHQMRDPDGGTMTGRMSASKPNIQQTPGRSVLGKKVRKCFIPTNGGQWLKLDYSQQEPRLLTHFACITKMPGAQNVAEMYRQGGDIYKYIVEAVGVDRNQSKTLTLGLMYGMGDEKLGASLGMSKSEASELRQKLYRQVPFLEKITVSVSTVARERGYIKTLLGRHQRFDDWEPNYNDGQMPVKSLERAQAIWPDKGLRRAWTHTALNRLIQGSAADMTKKAMTDTKCDIMIAVHDELGVEIQDPAEAVEIKRVAEECVKLALPVKADINIGKSWGG